MGGTITVEFSRPWGKLERLGTFDESTTVGRLKEHVRAFLKAAPEKDILLRYGDNRTLHDDKRLMEYPDIRGKDYLAVWPML